MTGRSKGLSRGEVARQLGVSKAHISELALRGEVPVDEDGRIRLKDADRVLKERANRRAGRPSAKEGKEKVSLAEAQRRKELALAEIRELDLEERAGRLVDADAVRKRVFEMARVERDAWLNWPARIGADLAAALGVEAHALTTELERHVRAHLAERATIGAMDPAGAGDGGPGLGRGTDAGPAPDGVGVGGSAPGAQR